MLVACTALAVGWLYVRRSPTPKPPLTEAASPRAFIPADALLVVSVDAERLRATPLGARLWAEGQSLAGLDQVSKLCHGDPLSVTRALALAVPAKTDVGFGLFAGGAFDAERLLGCAERVVLERGGKPVRVQQAGFWVLRDVSRPPSGVELAVRQGGPLVLSGASYVRQALALLPGQSVAGEPHHRELAALVGNGVVVATAVLGEEQRRTLVVELAAQGLVGSPFTSVRDGALALSIDRLVELRAVLRCDSAADCEKAARAIDDARRARAASPLALALGLTEVLSAATVRAHGATVELRASMPIDAALGLALQLLSLRALAAAPEHPAAATSPSLPASSMGERIAAPRPSGSAAVERTPPAGHPTAQGSAAPKASAPR